MRNVCRLLYLHMHKFLTATYLGRYLLDVFEPDTGGSEGAVKGYV